MTEKTTALLIDDERQIRRLLRLVLEAQNYRVLEADSGHQGLVEAAQRKPDVILLDLGLPDMDGQEVLQRLREWSHVPVLILSVRDGPDDKVRALDAAPTTLSPNRSNRTNCWRDYGRFKDAVQQISTKHFSSQAS